MLRAGGNAIDAAIAANAVLCVVYPHMTSIGGDLFALLWPAGAAAPVGLEGAGHSGAAATIEAMRERGFEGPRMPERGATTITVPGTVQAWGRLLETYGSVGFGRVLEPAIALARDGFVVGSNLARHFARHADLLMADGETQRVLPPLKEGMQLRQPDLAATLEVIARNGFGPFYFGEIGQAIAAAVQKRGGFLTASDLATFRSRGWIEPIAMPWRGLTVYEMPPPTQGLVAFAFLRALAQAPSPGPAFAEHFCAVRDAAYALRERWISDPEFAPVPAEPFLDFDAHGDTCYLCAADEHGNLVSLIQSIAFDFGSGIVADGTGVLLQNRGAYFSLEPAAVNRLEPRKRTMHTLIPALAAREGRPYAAFGNMAAEGQPQIQAQVALGLFKEGLEPQVAVARPRIRVAPGGAPLWVEADYPGALEMSRQGVAGRPVELIPPNDDRLGHAQAILVDDPDAWRGGADPRADGSVEIV